MNSRFAIALGAAIGALIGYILRQQPSGRGPVRAEIRVSTSSGRCVSETYPFTVYLRQGQLVSFDVVDPNDCLGAAHLEFRFPGDDSPLFDKRPKDKKHPNGKRFVQQNATFRAERGRLYDFEIWYVSSDEEYLMEDPEIQIEY